MPTAINWYDAAVRSIEATHEETRQCAPDVVGQLSALILKQIPKALASSLVSALPENICYNEREELSSCLNQASRSMRSDDAGIGYSDLVRQVIQSVCDSGRPMLDPSAAHRITDTFLWSFAAELPPQTKEDLLGALPDELRHRMNLLTSTADEARVA